MYSNDRHTLDTVSCTDTVSQQLHSELLTEALIVILDNLCRKLI